MRDREMIERNRERKWERERERGKEKKWMNFEGKEKLTGSVFNIAVRYSQKGGSFLYSV